MIIPLTVYFQLAYLCISIGVTIWVARTLHRNGRAFLLQAFRGDTELADSVNHLLVVGFYLVNVGLVALYLSLGEQATTVEEALPYLSFKIGTVLLVLGSMHFFNVYNFSKMRSKAKKALLAEEELAQRRLEIQQRHAHP